MIRTNLKSWLALAALLVIWLVFFSRTLFFGQVYFLDDLKIIYYPLEHVYAEFQHKWQLPQWSNEFGFGQPLLAWGQLGFFTPLHLILRLLGIHPIILLQTSIAAYFALGLLGMFLLLKKWNLSNIASATGAIVFVFSGYNIGHLSHVNFYTATMLAPWLLLTIEAFIRQPTILKTATLGIVAATITLSGQPQVVLHTLAMGTLYGVIQLVATLYTRRSLLHTAKIGSLTLVAATIAVSLSSLAILPLYEFLPSTERGEDLPIEELYEFSYPPSHAITLIFPFFFGDRTTYWGAKGFQELSAYVGILPLLLIAPALIHWHNKRTQRIFGIGLIVTSIIFALGKYSPLYTYLVENHILSTLSVPGRLVYFFVMGIAVLAAVGIDDLARRKPSNLDSLIAASAMLVLLFAPFLYFIQETPQALEELEELLKLNQPEAWLAIVGIALFIAYGLLSHVPAVRRYGKAALCICSTVTLILFGWNYNPLIDWQLARKPSPFSDTLQKFQQSTHIPPRLYSHTLIREQDNQQVKLTDPISPRLNIYQPLTVQHNNLKCLILSVEAGKGFNSGALELAIQEEINSEPLRRVTLFVTDTKTSEHRVCFDPLPAEPNKQLLLSIKSNEYNGIRLLQKLALYEETRAYIARPPSPSDQTMEISRANFRILFQQEGIPLMDNETALLNRHLNVTANASSTRWIGALSIKPYREFVEQFFANDGEPIDGDNIHVIQRHRTILNMAGITHLTQQLHEESDKGMAEAGFKALDNISTGTSKVALYENPQAYPKAFLVRNALLKTGRDQTRYELLQPDYNPRNLLYIDAPTLPETLPQQSNKPLNAKATITRYEPTYVEVKVDTTEPAFLVLTDAATPQWQTYIDGHATEQIIANSVFRAALVPAGNSTVSFRYYSPAIELSKKLTAIGLAISIALILATTAQRISKSL